ncbi:hypothetical protein [uncultured Sphaerochaeta sp.]|uniref:hypothetical protein n=1 Tax=uncultured Sphaerochaeta sp. TaxID=886478 RepID=UPI002A0A920F|nr:hypothetical protein [uncultured Sphaerochaeta sp.]
MIDTTLNGKEIVAKDIAHLIIGGQTGVDGIRFCIAQTVAGEDLSDPLFTWYLQPKNKNGQGEPVLLAPVYEDNLIKLSWVPGITATQVSGRLQIQIYAQKVVEDILTKKWVSAPAVVYVEENLNPDAIVPVVPTVLDQYLVMFQSLKDAAEAAATIAEEQALIAGQQASDASDSAGAALLSAQGAASSEGAALASEEGAALSAGEALESKNSAGLSEIAAGESATASLASENAAKASEDAAKISETNAGTSETNAASSESTALEYRDQCLAALVSASIGKRYGIRIRVADGVVERTGSGIGLTFTRAAGSVNPVKSDFSPLTPWANNRRCLLDDMGKIVCYKGDDTWVSKKAELNGAGEKLYHRGTAFRYYFGRDEIVTIDGVDWRYIEVSDSKLPGLEVMPAFRRADGTIREEIVIAAIKTGKDAAGKACWKSGIAPLTNTSCLSFDTLYNNLTPDTHWMGEHFTTNDVWTYLLAVETGSLNGQSTVGAGISSGMPYTGTNATAACTIAQTGATSIIVSNAWGSQFYAGMIAQIGTGYSNNSIAPNRKVLSTEALEDGINTQVNLDGNAFNSVLGNTIVTWGQSVDEEQLDSIDMDCGYILQWGSESRSHVYVYGLADAWANVYAFERGKQRVDGNWYICWDPEKSRLISNPVGADGWEDLGLIQFITNGYLKTVKVVRRDGKFTWIPWESGASTATFYCDYIYYFSAEYLGVRIIARFGSWYNGAGCGPWCLNGCCSPSDVGIYYGDRGISLEPLAA